MQKILHSVASLAPRHGGPTVAALGMVKAQRILGADARIISSDDDLGAHLPVQTGQWIEHEGVPVFFLPRTAAKQHTLVGYTHTLGYPAWIRTHAREYDFVHVHTVFSHPANATMSVCRALGVPYCVRPLGQLCHWSLEQRRWLKKIQLALFTRRNINAARYIHCTSDMEADETSASGFTSPCRVLPHGLDAPPLIPDAQFRLRQRLGISNTTPILIFMSRIHPKKGIELLLDAAQMLQVRKIPFHLAIAGTGDDNYLHQLQHNAQQQIGNAVSWLGFLNGEEKWLALQGADLFVLPSKSENFAIAVLEASACGLPVVISDQIALEKEVRRHQLGLVTRLDTAELAQALQQLLSLDPSTRSAHRKTFASTTLQHFGWPAAAQRLLDSYQPL